MAQITRLEQKAPSKRPEDVAVIEKPNFGRSLRNQERLIEGQAVHMEATLTPVNDPTMKVEWFFNGQPIPSGESLCASKEELSIVSALSSFPCKFRWGLRTICFIRLLLKLRFLWVIS